MTAHFDPPYESPIEEDLAWGLGKYLASGVVLKKQVECDTRCGRFRVDLVLLMDGAPKMGLECDGAAFHDEARDEWRDALLLGDQQVEAILRLRGTDIYYRQADLLHLMARLYPGFFSDRGRDALLHLASPAARAAYLVHNHRVTVRYLDEPWIGGEPSYLQLTHRTIHHAPEQHPFWRSLYAYARECAPTTLDEVIAAFHARGLRRL